jgi:hypothetical protein
LGPLTRFYLALLLLFDYYVILLGVGVLLAADSLSTSSSGYRASLWDPKPDFILLFFLRLTITFFFFRLLRVRVTLQLTVSQSVCLGVEPNLGLLSFELFLLPTVSRPLRLGIEHPFGILDLILSCSSSFV